MFFQYLSTKANSVMACYHSGSSLLFFASFFFLHLIQLQRRSLASQVDHLVSHPAPYKPPGTLSTPTSFNAKKKKLVAEASLITVWDFHRGKKYNWNKAGLPCHDSQWMLISMGSTEEEIREQWKISQSEETNKPAETGRCLLGLRWTRTGFWMQFADMAGFPRTEAFAH